MPNKSTDLADVLKGLDEEMLDALREDLPDIPGMPASNEGLEAEFFAQAYQFARSWLTERGGKVTDAKPAVMVLSRAIQQDSQRLQAKPRPYFCAMPDRDCDGQMLIANDDFSRVVQLEDVAIDDVTDAADLLEQLGLNDCAHVVFRPDRGELILMREGLLGTPKLVPITLGAPVRLSQVDLERKIWVFHTEFTQTPSGYINCWRGKASDRVPIEELERQVSALLGFYLRTIVGYENISIEHHTSHGRVDVAVFSPAMLSGLGSCAIELKVLRSRQWRSTTKGWDSVNEDAMIRHASEGVQQAVDYRTKLGGNIAYLCCFDARIDDVDQSAVAGLASKKKVDLRRYYMYDSQDAYRAAREKADEAGLLLSGEV